MKIEVSIGEIVDKFTILAIKKEMIIDTEKLKNIEKEYDSLYLVIKELRLNILDNPLLKKLIWVNKKLWKVEDLLRYYERQQKFDKDFILLARAVYKLNDYRFKIKNKINILYDSDFKEEKSYSKY
jgi:hypothetical protein